jgi:fucose 4-O-acetylase-like acetyltransferase
VVLHHVAVGYGGSGGWPIRETPTDGISPILLLLFNAVNQSYFMAFFFLLAGYFVPRSYDRKGPLQFVLDRLVRLGIPLVVYVVFIAPFIDYVVINLARGGTVSYVSRILYKIRSGHLDVGPLWFVEALLIFAGMYVLYRLIADRFWPNFAFTPYKGVFPANTAIALSIAVLAAGTFLVRIWYPVGVHFYHFQLGHWVHYGFCFWFGILASRGKWFENLSASQGKLWGIVALIAILFLPVMFVVGSMLVGDNLDVLLGGLGWLPFSVSLWESVACLSIITWLLYLFRTKLNHQGRLLKGLAPNVYTVYIVHAFVITFLMALFLSVALPTAAKFGVVALLGVPMCFIISHFIIRQIPYSTRVLG